MASPKEGFAGLTINMRVSLHTRLKTRAAIQRRSMTEIIDESVSTYLDRVEVAEMLEQAEAKR